MKKFAISRNKKRNIRHARILKKMKKHNCKLFRLIVTKTNANIFAQIFDDKKGVTVASSSSLQLKLKNGNKLSCEKVGIDIAKKALAKNIKSVAFDRGGNKYHGRIASLADAARKAGLQF